LTTAARDSTEFPLPFAGHRQRQFRSKDIVLYDQIADFNRADVDPVAVAEFAAVVLAPEYALPILAGAAAFWG